MPGTGRFGVGKSQELHPGLLGGRVAADQALEPFSFAFPGM